MSKAVVLGGGGPVGIGWEAGLVIGLADAGIRLGDADRIIGTSAGSVVGALLALGMDITEQLALASAPLPVPSPEAANAGLAALFAAIGAAVAHGATAAEVRVAVGRVSLDAATVEEETFVEAFSAVDGAEWPTSYWCTAVETATGERHVWDAAGGVQLPRAVASSCSVPGIFPPITIDGHRYMDGGMQTALNSDLATGHDVVIVVSCMPLSLPEGFSDPVVDAVNAVQAAELEALRAACAGLEVITPSEEFLEISGWGLNLMDPGLVPASFEAGRRQAAAETARIGPAWSR